MKDAQTYADYIGYDMEHASFDVKGLQEYMRGLAAGGPDRSGHRTPAVSCSGSPSSISMRKVLYHIVVRPFLACCRWL
jgi:hypothetical protein